MLSEINKLFGRDFVIGFFVPSIVFVAGTLGEFWAFRPLPEWLRRLETGPVDPLKETTSLALVIICLAFLLMGVNRLIFRALEGYWVFNLGSRLNHLQLWSFRRLQRKLTALTAEHSRCDEQQIPFTKIEEYDQLMYKAAVRFPAEERYVMCTAFGNSVSAFEDYPRTMYGFESINGWPRLNAVLPKDFREILGNMRAGTDLWVNIWFVGLLLTAEFLTMALWRSQWRHPWIPAVSILVAVFASWQARIAAEGWGEWVKAAFDVFLPTLCSRLGYERGRDLEEEHRLWDTFSQAIVFRDPLSLQALADRRSLRPAVERETQGEQKAKEDQEE